MVYGVWRGGVLRGVLRRAGLCSGEMSHVAGDMRAYGAREGIAGVYGAGDSAGYGERGGEIERAAKSRNYIG